MSVYHHLILLARTVVMPAREYHDLVIIPGAEPRYGVFDQPRDLWREEFDEATCRQRLEQWPDIPVDYRQRNKTSSHVTVAGRRWLEGTA